MSQIAPAQAVERMAEEIEHHLPADEVLEVYNDLFRRNGPPPGDEKTQRERIAAYVRGGRSLDMVMELWSLIFTKYQDVWYNEIDDVIEYNEGDEFAD
jgi:hypothetical protein